MPIYICYRKFAFIDQTPNDSTGTYLIQMIIEFEFLHGFPPSFISNIGQNYSIRVKKIYPMQLARDVKKNWKKYQYFKTIQTSTYFNFLKNRNEQVGMR